MQARRGFITLLEVALGTVIIVLAVASLWFLLQLLQTYNQGLVNQSLAASLAKLRLEEIRSLPYSSITPALGDAKNAQIPVVGYSQAHPESSVSDPEPQFQNFFMNTQVAATGTIGAPGVPGTTGISGPTVTPGTNGATGTTGITLTGGSEQTVTVWVFYQGLLGRQDSYVLSTIFTQP